MSTITEEFSQLLREVESDIGTRDMSMLFLSSFVDAIKAIKTDQCDDFCGEIQKLLNIISNTEPKFGILNYNLAKIFEGFRCDVCAPNFKGGKSVWKSLVIKKVQEVLNQAKSEKKMVIENAEKIDVNGKTILIHDHSHTVQDILAHYKYLGRDFKVIVAEQEHEKTHSNIERLHASGIPFQVIPSYMISHVMKSIDMLFFGAVTLKDTMEFVMDPGSHAIISEFHLERVPIYMFIDTSKFSLWKSKKRSEIFFRKQIRKHQVKAIEYERIKYSHDRVPVNLFKEIVTNKGIFTPLQLERLYKEKFEKYAGKK